MEKFNRKFGGIVILILANAVFALLYLRFLTGDAVYLYTDIGSDSVTSGYPVIVMLQRLFSSGDFSGYSLTAGLGSSTLVPLIKYLNPIRLPLLFFTGERLPYGLIIELLIQTNVIALFSFVFFRRLLNHGTAALFASLAWTFSGYITLRSQNLSAGSSMAMFTVVMAALLPVLMKPTVRKCILLSLSLAFFLLTDCYDCYMSAWFILLFLIFHSAAVKKSVTEFFISGLTVLGSALFAALLAAFSLLPSLTGFASSGKTGAVSAAAGRYGIADPKELFTILARLFSVNTLGAGSSYSGTQNYYDAAALSTTILAVTAVIYLLSQENTRLLTVLAILTAVSLLIFKNASALIQFNSEVRRFSFMIAFAEACAVGVFIKSLMTNSYGIPLFWSALISLLLDAGIFLFLNFFDARLDIHSDPLSLELAAAAAAAFSLILIIYAFGFRISPVMPYLALCVLMCELTAMNYATVSKRDYVTPGQYEEIASAGSVREAVSLIRSDDPGLFRIAAASHTDDANTGMLLDFPAASVLSSMNPGSLSTLTKAHGTCGVSPDYFLTDASVFGQLSFLAGKYLLTETDGTLANTPPAALFKKTGETGDGSLSIYENETALPFGYFYTSQISAAYAKELPLPDRIYALTQSWYRTDGISTVHSEETENISDFLKTDHLFEKTDLITSGVRPNHLKQRKTSSGIVFQPTGGDPYLFYEIGKAKAGSVRMLYMRLKNSNFDRVRRMQIFFMGSADKEPEADDSRQFYLGKGYPEVCLIIPDGAEMIRLDFPEDYIETSVTELMLLESSEIPQLFKDLQATDIRNVSMDGASYRAEITTQKEGMLCIPLLFSDNWTALVNGRPANVQNINGGLVGVALPEGTSEVILTWKLRWMEIFLCISGAALLFALIIFIFPPFRKNRQN